MRSSIVVFSVILVWGHLQNTAMAEHKGSEDVQLMAVYDTIQRAVERLHSVEYTAEYSRIQHLDGGKSTTHSMSYAFDGNLFHSRSKWKSISRGTMHDWQWAYDGENYQFEDAAFQRLDRSKAPMKGGPIISGALQPLVVPFRFAFGEKMTLDFQSIQTESAWRSVAANSKIVGNRNVDGRDCLEVAVQSTNGDGIPVSWNVLLAKELQYFPLKLTSDLTMEKNAIHNDVDVKPDVIETPAGVVVVPTRISQLTYRNKELMLTQEYQIESKSLRVNQSVDRKRFTLSESEAEGGVYDRDENKYLVPPTAKWIERRDESVARRKAEVKPESRRPIWRYLVGFNVVLGVVVVVFVAVRRSRKRVA